MPNGGESRRERELEEEERSVAEETFTDAAGNTTIVQDNYYDEAELNRRLIEAGLNPKTTTFTGNVNVNEQPKESPTIAKGYLVRMLTGNKSYLAYKVDKVEGQKALEQVIKKGGKYSAIATGIPALGISTAVGALVGGSVALIEIFTQNNNAKTAKTIIGDFVISLFDKSIVKREKVRDFTFVSVEPVLYREDINELIDLIKQTFIGTKLEKAANSLYLSETHAYYVTDILNVVKFRVSINPKPGTVMDLKKLGLIGAGLLALKFLIFKG